MKVIGISGSSRKNGNTANLINVVFAELEKQGIETELIQLFDKEMKFCTGCFACKATGTCVIKDDGFQECFTKMLQADGILLGSPVYSADITAKLKAFLERAGVIVAMRPGLFKYKVGASIAAVRRAGGMTAVDTMNHFLLNKEVIIVGSTYWNMVYGNAIGEVADDAEGMQNMRNLGENMAHVLKKMKSSNLA